MKFLTNSLKWCKDKMKICYFDNLLCEKYVPFVG